MISISVFVMDKRLVDIINHHGVHLNLTELLFEALILLFNGLFL